MTCRQIQGAVVCGRGRHGRRQLARPACRVPGCPRYATQANWGCRTHYFRLSPELRRALYFLARDDQAGRSWRVVAEEADRWIADHPPEAPRRDRRQRELGL